MKRCHVERIPGWIAALSGGPAISLPPAGQSCEGGLHRHHLVTRQDGGRSTPENIVMLCKKHHDMVHRIMRIYGRAEFGHRQLPLLPS